MNLLAPKPADQFALLHYMLIEIEQEKNSPYHFSFLVNASYRRVLRDRGRRGMQEQA